MSGGKDGNSGCSGASVSGGKDGNSDCSGASVSGGKDGNSGYLGHGRGLPRAGREVQVLLGNNRRFEHHKCCGGTATS